MEKVKLGRTGLTVSVAGLGCGGFSRLGLGTGKSFESAANVVKCALENEIDFIDTAELYGTEPAVGAGIKGFDRGEFVISSKFAYSNMETGELRPTEDFEKTLDKCLTNLGTEYVDIYHLHGVSPRNYRAAVERFYPEMLKARDKGKIRFLGITELFNEDTTHEMLKRAVQENLFDVTMIGYNILNQSAAAEVLSELKKIDVGTLNMFAVRNAFSKPDRLREILQPLGIDNLDWLVADGYASSLPEAAYRFCRHTPGIDVVLTGTGETAHLIENIGSINMEPLDKSAVDRLVEIFKGFDNVSGQ